MTRGPHSGVSVVESLGHGRYRVSRDRRNTVAWAAVDAGVVWVSLHGRTWTVTLDGDVRQGGGGRRDEDALSAPMPAIVATVHVSNGQPVSAGDALVTLEAMKMELQIVAPRDGTVGLLACEAGDLVQPGVPLLELQ